MTNEPRPIVKLCQPLLYLQYSHVGISHHDLQYRCDINRLGNIINICVIL